MYEHSILHPLSQRGVALVSAMLLLIVTTLLGVSMFRSFGLQEKIAGNTREKQRALHAAESAQIYAEWWLASATGANATNGTTCNSVTSTPQVCANILQNSANLPWAARVSHTPAMLTVAASGVLDGYYAAPSLYISFLAEVYDPTTGTETHTYQVDAQGYGGSKNAAAVVESTYSVSVTHSTRTDDSKFINLGGP